MRKSRSAPLSLQRARSYAPSSSRVGSPVHMHGLGYGSGRAVGVRTTRRFAPRLIASAAALARSCVSTVRPAHRPHSAQDSKEAFQRESASSRSCDTTLARRRLRYRDCRNDGADRLRALARQFAPATMLMLARLCLRQHCHAKHRRLSCARLAVPARVTPRFQLTALRCALLASGE